MATYNNLDSLYKALGKQVEVALSKTATDLVEKATQLIWEEFYQKYTPQGKDAYERTFQLLNSVVKSSVKHTGGTYSVEVYLDPNGVQYADQNVMDIFILASEGYHGNKSIKRDGEFFKELVKHAFDNYRSYLIKHGLNVI